MATEYSVFRLNVDGSYTPSGKSGAHSPQAAAKEVDQERGQRYLVVPTSNAHYVDLSVEQVTRVVAKKATGPDFPQVGQVSLTDGEVAHTGIPVPADGPEAELPAA